jgi:hypothetical protein
MFYCHKSLELFIVYYNDAVSNSGYIALNDGVINAYYIRNGNGRKRSWPNLRYYPRICVEENHENLSQDSRFSDRDVNTNTKQECQPLSRDVQ